MRIKKLVTMAISMALCLQMLPAASLAANVETEKAISGNGVKVVYDETSHQVTLYRTEGAEAIQMSKPADQGYPIVNNQPVQDFVPTTCTVEADVVGLMGAGDRMTIVSQSASTGLTRTYVMETSDAVVGAIYTTTSYQGGETAVTPTWFVDNVFEIYNPADRIWSYNGGGEGPMHYYDTLQKIDLTDSGKFSRENKQDSTAASIPVADIYTADGGITIGDASATRREVHTPVMETADSANVSIKWPGKAITAGNSIEVGQSFINVHVGDFYVGLRGYKDTMECVGIIMPSNVAERSYDLRWEGWGWGTNWTVELIIGKLDELQAAGIKQITIDDGWYNSAGDWGLNPSKFPNGNTDMLRLTDAIHAHGMSAILWWRPCDGGMNSTLFRQHPEYFVKGTNGSRTRLPGAGGGDAGLGYALCPGSQGAIDSQIEFVNRAMNQWNFDGFKGDFVWSMPKCYDETHNHPYPQDSTEKQAELYRTSYEAMVANDPDVFNLLCNCGTPQDYYSLPYMTQVATADPTSLDQTRTRVKAYKALMGDFFPVTTDHNSVWYPSAVGTGAVLIEKRAFNAADQATYEQWLNIASEVQLHKGRFVGDLYSYGFDPYETYVVEQDGVMHYAFYRDGNKYKPASGESPDIVLKGLDPSKMYRIVDYVNDRVVATNVMGDAAIFNVRFSDSLLLKAVEITTPDPEPVDPDWGFTSVDAMSDDLVYTGTWHDDHNPNFYEGTARYTNETDASVEFTFAGKSIRWYGQKDSNFGTADVYMDGEFVKTVNANGGAETNVRLFESLDLSAAIHTIKIVRKTGVIDVDRFAFEAATPEPVYLKVDALSDSITYSGSWTVEHNSEYYMGNAKYTTEAGAAAELTFNGTAIRWVGQKYPQPANAKIYLDGEFVGSVYNWGETKPGTIIFERNELAPGEHTIRIVVTTDGARLDLDYLSYIESEVPDPGHEYLSVDAMDEALIYTGAWHDDNNPAFSEGSARYTNSVGASVEFAFTGTDIRWYGQNDVNFGMARVYVDGELAGTVNCNGVAATGKLLFERNELLAGEHTIRIECETLVIDIDYLSYANRA